MSRKPVALAWHPDVNRLSVLLRLLFRISASVILTMIATSLVGCSSPAEIIGPIPDSARLLKHQTIVYGFDKIHVFVFSTTDAQLRETLVDKWDLHDLTNHEENPVSWAENAYARNDYPKWWPSKWPPETRGYGRRCDEEERYWSVWESPERGRLYVEVGQW